MLWTPYQYMRRYCYFRVIIFIVCIAVCAHKLPSCIICSKFWTYRTLEKHCPLDTFMVCDSQCLLLQWLLSPLQTWSGQLGQSDSPCWDQKNHGHLEDCHSGRWGEQHWDTGQSDFAMITMYLHCIQGSRFTWFLSMCSRLLNPHFAASCKTESLLNMVVCRVSFLWYF